MSMICGIGIFMSYRRKYAVTSPTYIEIVPICDDGTGPAESACEYIEVEADNPEDAKILGVKLLERKAHCQRFAWCDNSENPYKGV